MLTVSVSRDLYRYEIHSLIKAFYPEEEVRTYVEEQSTAPSFLRAVFAPDEIRLAFSDAASGEEEFGEENLLFHIHGGTGTVRLSSAVTEKKGICFADEKDSGSSEDAGCHLDEKSRTCKTALKHLLYRMLCLRTGKTLPWGELIGIRPTKIASRRLEEGMTEEEAAAWMERSHYVSPGKAGLAAQIAGREAKILREFDPVNGYSLYIGIPFCPTTCLYCSFPSYGIGLWNRPVRDLRKDGTLGNAPSPVIDRLLENLPADADGVELYLALLEEEMETSAALMEGKYPETIYFGGGTPSSLSAAQMERVFAAVRRHFPTERVREYTVEAGRPDSITQDKLIVMRKAGVTRISVNPQTMKEETLRVIGRHHTARQTQEAFAAAREAGFTNINMDMILGLPGETPDDVRYTLSAIEEMRPDSLTVHSLAVKKGSKMQEIVRQSGYEGLGLAAGTMELAIDAARRMDLLPYYLYRQKNMTGNDENIGFAREGCFGLYNILIMEETQSILALGCGGISKRVFPPAFPAARGKILRSENAHELRVYMEHFEEMKTRKSNLFGDM